MPWILYVHILSACAWVGGSIMLFGLGIFIKDKSEQDSIYGIIRPFYGYFETIWLLVLIVTGLLLGQHYDLLTSIGKRGNVLDDYITIKIVLVSLLSFMTLIHLYIAFSTHKKTRSLYQMLLSRGASLSIFILNLAILWVAMNISTLV